MKGPHDRNKFVLEVQHEGDLRPRNFKPTRATYSRSRNAPFNSWHLMKTEVQAARAMASSGPRTRTAEQDLLREGE